MSGFRGHLALGTSHLACVTTLQAMEQPPHTSTALCQVDLKVFNQEFAIQSVNLGHM